MEVKYPTVQLHFTKFTVELVSVFILGRFVNYL